MKTSQLRPRATWQAERREENQLKHIVAMKPARPGGLARQRCGARLHGVRSRRRCTAPCMADPDTPGALFPRCRVHGGAAMLGYRRWWERTGRDYWARTNRGRNR